MKLFDKTFVFRPVLSVLLAAVCICLSSSAQAAETKAAGQVVIKSGTYAPAKAPATTFSGTVHVERIFKANADAPYTAAYVTFEPGARTFWHSHVSGQHLIVTSGTGLTGTEDGTVTVIKAGDEIWCPPAVKHWHGAAPDTAMTHIAITGVKDGKSTDWMEAVTDEQYNAR